MTKMSPAELLKNGSKVECMEKAEHFLGLGIKYEEDAKNSSAPDDEKAKSGRLVEMALKNAVKYEDAALDGRE